MVLYVRGYIYREEQGLRGVFWRSNIVKSEYSALKGLGFNRLLKNNIDL